MTVLFPSQLRTLGRKFQSQLMQPIPIIESQTKNHKPMNPTMRTFFLFLIFSSVASCILRADESMSDADLKALLHERIDVAKHDVGIVVGVLDEKGQRIIAHGKTAYENGRDVDGNTLFEIGSLSKTFTSI